MGVDKASYCLPPAVGDTLIASPSLSVQFSDDRYSDHAYQITHFKLYNSTAQFSLPPDGAWRELGDSLHKQLHLLSAPVAVENRGGVGVCRGRLGGWECAHPVIQTIELAIFYIVSFTIMYHYICHSTNNKFSNKKLRKVTSPVAVLCSAYL